MKRFFNLKVNLIDRYIITEIFFPFSALLLIFTMLMILGNIKTLIELIVMRGVELIYVFQLLILLIPQFIGFIIPIALFIGIITAMFRISSDNEITVLKSSGISLYRISMPVMIFSSSCLIVCLYMMLVITPSSYNYFKNFSLELINNRAVIGLQEKSFNEITEGFVLYPNEITSKGTIKGVLISDSRDPKNKKVIFANRGKIIPEKDSYNLSLRLSDGSIHINGNLSDVYRLIKFSTMVLKLNFLRKLETKNFNSLRMMSVDELLELREEYREDQKKYNRISLSIHQKFAIPFSCLVFGLLAVPFGIIFQRSGKEPGYAVCIILMLIYFIFFMAGKRLGEEGIINPVTATWAPNFIFFAIGLYLLYKVANDKSSWLLEISQRITFIFSRLQNKLSRRTSYEG